MKHTLKGQWSNRQVWLDGRELRPEFSQTVRNYSPDGFNWGYGGSGPAQLALAVLLALTERDTALRAYQRFKGAVIAVLPQDDFSIAFDWPNQDKVTVHGKELL